jgi:hypothetical protein
VRAEVSPHLLGPHRLVEEDEGVGQTRPAQPSRLGNPLLNLLQVVLEDLGGDAGSELLGETGGVLALSRARGVSVPGSRLATGSFAEDESQRTG